MKRTAVARLLAAMTAITLAGCGGNADVTIVNNASRYVTGDIDGSKFGIVPGGQTQRSVEVGGGFSSSSKVTMHADIHAGWDAATAIETSVTGTKKMQVDQAYTWEVYLTTLNRPAFRLLDVKSNRPGLQP